MDMIQTDSGCLDGTEHKTPARQKFERFSHWGIGVKEIAAIDPMARLLNTSTLRVLLEEQPMGTSITVKKTPAKNFW